MEVDTNELLHRIGAVLRVISDKLDRLIEIAERVEGEVRLPAELEAQTFANAKELAKKWRILGPGEEVQEGDLMNCKLNPPSYPPNGDGWIDASICVGSEVAASDECVFARPVADEPAKEPEPEHPAGPMPDPGEGYRLLRKDPPEELTPGDEHELSKGEWVESANARTHRVQGPGIWYRRKIEPPKDEYREPVLPADVGQPCEFSMTGKDWYPSLLSGFQVHNNPWISSNLGRWNFARIKKDA